MDELEGLEAKISEIFFPYQTDRMAKFMEENKRFVHYTSAAAAMNIFKSKQIWLRQPYFMNDYRELEHGLQCLVSAYREQNQFFKNTVDQIYEGLSNEIEQEFDHLLKVSRQDLYLFCVSEHEDAEDVFGRLSMWRAYGKEVGVAIVMNQSSFFSELNGLKSYMSPVTYSESSDFLLSFNKIAGNILMNKAFIQTLLREDFKRIILNMFRDHVLTTKHKGFAEEKEWRVIYSPGIESSDHLIHGLETINGFPQEVYKVPFKNDPDKGVVNIEPDELIDRIIIGPTQYPLPLYKAFVKILENAGVKDAGVKVFISDIPLRS